jgi:hypothetical protein
MYLFAIVAEAGDPKLHDSVYCEFSLVVNGEAMADKITALVRREPGVGVWRREAPSRLRGTTTSA